jgi:hypothetical protein
MENKENMKNMGNIKYMENIKEMENTKKRKNIAEEGPIKKINTNYYNPLIHTTPSGLEGSVLLETQGKNPRDKLIVYQNTRPVVKPLISQNKDEDYGQFVELGGKRKSKGKKKINRKLKTRKIRKNKKRKTIRKYRK